LALSKKYKAYITENRKKLSVDEMAQELNVGAKIIQRFIKTLSPVKKDKP